MYILNSVTSHTILKTRNDYIKYCENSSSTTYFVQLYLVIELLKMGVLKYLHYYQIETLIFKEENYF